MTSSSTPRIAPSRSLRAVLATAALAVGAAFSLPAAAAPHHGGGFGPMGGGPRMERMLDAVDATPEQRAQIKQIFDAARSDLRGQREQARALRQQVMTLFTQPTVDARAAEALRAQMSAQQDAASKRMLQAMLDASRVLTPQQRQQLAEKMQQRRAMMERHMNERRSLDQGAPRQ